MCNKSMNCRACKNNGNGLAVSLCVERFAQALKAEKAKSKIWDGAPYNAQRVTLNFFDNHENYIINSVKSYTHAIPKTKARLIAEKLEYALNDLHLKERIDLIEKAILEAQGEGK